MTLVSLVDGKHLLVYAPPSTPRICLSYPLLVYIRSITQALYSIYTLYLALYNPHPIYGKRLAYPLPSPPFHPLLYMPLPSPPLPSPVALIDGLYLFNMTTNGLAEKAWDYAMCLSERSLALGREMITLGVYRPVLLVEGLVELGKIAQLMANTTVSDQCIETLGIESIYAIEQLLYVSSSS